ncbi:MAG TPA: hypothetical protein EYG88_01635 [Desulfocapsa sulfexigens]|nr:hypothetical protein [Desulfocapsa sulfexigens]
MNIARKILENIGETPEALRDLSVSLDNVGNTAKALGQWDKAQKAFTEALGIAELLAKTLPDLVAYNTLADHFRHRLQTMRSSDNK